MTIQRIINQWHSSIRLSRMIYYRVWILPTLPDYQNFSFQMVHQEHGHHRSTQACRQTGRTASETGQRKHNLIRQTQVFNQPLILHLQWNLQLYLITQSQLSQFCTFLPFASVVAQQTKIIVSSGWQLLFISINCTFTHVRTEQLVRTWMAIRVKIRLCPLW